jgi:hypothetical protein
MSAVTWFVAFCANSKRKAARLVYVMAHQYIGGERAIKRVIT